MALRTAVNRKAPPVDAYQGGPYASAFQDATNAQAAMAREDFGQDVGQLVGGLNSIGALRSGRATTTINDASRTFGRQVGNIAAANAGQLATLNFQGAEGDKNRALEADRNAISREGMAMQDRQFGQTLDFNRTRATRADFESDRGFGAAEDQRTKDNTFRTDRATRDDFESDRTFGENRRQFDDTMGFQRERATRGDMESDRVFDRGVLESDRTFDFNKGRADRQDMESDRTFGFTKERAARSDFESDRGYTYQTGRDQVLDQRDQRNYDRSVMESDRNFGEGKRQFDVATDAQRTSARQAGQAAVWGTALGNIDKIGGLAKRVGGFLGVGGAAGGAGTAAGGGAATAGLGGMATLGLAGAGVAGAMASAKNERRISTNKATEGFLKLADDPRVPPADREAARQMAAYVEQNGKLPPKNWRPS